MNCLFLLLFPDPTRVIAVIVLAVVIFLAYLQSRRRSILLMVALLVFMMIAPNPKANTTVLYQGKDQFEWLQIAKNGEAMARTEAITALCILIGKYPNHYSVFELGLQGLEEIRSQEAIPQLLEVRNNLTEPKKRDRIDAAIRTIEQGGVQPLKAGARTGRGPIRDGLALAS